MHKWCLFFFFIWVDEYASSELCMEAESAQPHLSEIHILSIPPSEPSHFSPSLPARQAFLLFLPATQEFPHFPTPAPLQYLSFLHRLPGLPNEKMPPLIVFPCHMQCLHQDLLHWRTLSDQAGEDHTDGIIQDLFMIQRSKQFDIYCKHWSQNCTRCQLWTLFPQLYNINYTISSSRLMSGCDRLGWWPFCLAILAGSNITGILYQFWCADSVLLIILAYIAVFPGSSCFLICLESIKTWQIGNIMLDAVSCILSIPFPVGIEGNCLTGVCADRFIGCEWHFRETDHPWSHKHLTWIHPGILLPSSVGLTQAAGSMAWSHGTPTLVMFFICIHSRCFPESIGHFTFRIGQPAECQCMGDSVSCSPIFWLAFSSYSWQPNGPCVRVLRFCPCGWHIAYGNWPICTLSCRRWDLTH